MSTQLSNKDLRFASVLREQLRLSRFLLSFRGLMTYEITGGLLTMTERKLEQEGTEEELKKKVLVVMIRCLQNILRYQVKDGLLNSSIFMIGRQEDDYVILSGSLIDNHRVAFLQDRLSALNAADDVDRSNLFEALLRKGIERSGQNTPDALEEIAIKTNKRLEYGVEKISEQHSFFSLRVSVR